MFILNRVFFWFGFFYGFLKDCNTEFSYTTLADDDVTRSPGIVVIAVDRGSNITGSECFGMFSFLVVIQSKILWEI